MISLLATRPSATTAMIVVGLFFLLGTLGVYAQSGTSVTETSRITASDSAAAGQFGYSFDVSNDVIAVGTENENNVWIFRFNNNSWNSILKLSGTGGFGAQVKFGSGGLGVSAPAAAYSTYPYGGCSTWYTAPRGSVHFFAQNQYFFSYVREFRFAPDTSGPFTYANCDTSMDGGRDFSLGSNLFVGFPGLGNNGYVGVGYFHGDSGYITGFWSPYSTLPTEPTRTCGRRLSLLSSRLVVGCADEIRVFDTSTFQFTTQKLGGVGTGFGESLDQSQTRLVVGAPSAYDGRGTVFVYTWSGTSLVFEQELSPSVLDGVYGFGTSVSIEGDSIVVGAPASTVGSLGNVGRLFQFSKGSSAWTENAIFDLSKPLGGELFGTKVKLSSGKVFGALTNSLTGRRGAVAFYDSLRASGRVSTSSGPLGGVSLTLSGTSSSGGMSNTTGDFSIALSSSGSYTITPFKSGYSFSPSSRDLTNLLASASSQDFSATICSSSLSLTPSGTVSLSALTQETIVGVGATNSGCNWTATSDSSWLSVTSGTQGTGAGQVGLSVTQNVGPARTATLNVGGQTVQVQQASGCTQTLSTSSASATASGVSGSFNVSGNTGCLWTATSNDSWITVTAGASGSGNGTVSYSVAPSATIARVGTITVGDKTFTVNQASGCAYSLSSSSLTLPAAAGSGSVTLSTNSACPWTATSNTPAWITLTSSSSGTGTATVTISVSANTGNSRSGTVTVGGQTLTVTQESGCAFTLSSILTNFSTASGTGSFSVNTTSGCSWTATKIASWITITSGASGSGTGTVSFSVSANTGPQRVGTISVGGQTHTLIQASGCTYSVPSQAASFPSTGGIAGMPVSTNAGCEWTASSSAPWLRLTKSSGSGAEDVLYAVDPNAGVARSGTITVQGRTFTVNQAATGACISVSIPNLGVLPSTDISVPVSISDVTGRNITAFDLEITFDSQVVQVAPAIFDTTGALSAGYSVSANRDIPGRLLISGFGVTPLSGSGVLMNLKFTAVGANRTQSAVTLSAFRFNEGDPCSVNTNGSLTVSSTALAGTVKYFFAASGQVPVNIPGVTVTASGSRTVGAVTGSTGTFSLQSLGTGAYTLTPTKPTAGLEGISSLDASWIAQYLIGVRSLTANQLVAGDVTGNGSVTSLDASRIAQTLVGVSNPSIVGTWAFVPGSRSYASVDQALAAQDFEAVVMGDVTGSWTPPAGLDGNDAFSLFTAYSGSWQFVTEPIDISIPQLSGRGGELITVPIYVSDLSTESITAFDAVIKFDPKIMALVGLSDAYGSLTTNFSSIANEFEPGRVRVSSYGVAPLTGKGNLFNVTFRISRRRMVTTPVEIESFVFNEGLPKTRISHGSVRIGMVR